MSQRPIGIFDSGIGGLSIARTILNKFPHENFIYFADTKNIPYGSKTNTEIKNYVSSVVDFLLKENVKAIVVACNTASANMNHLKLDIPLIGMIEPTCREVVKTTKNKRVLLLATEATVRSKLYSNCLKKFQITPFLFPVPEFVFLVETLMHNTAKSYELTKRLLTPFVTEDIDTVILGCTHFGFLKNEIQKVFPEALLVDGSNEVARELNLSLKTEPIKKGKGTFKLYTTGNDKKFIEQVKNLKIKYDQIISVTL